MGMPRQPGSRVVDAMPNIVRDIRGLMGQVRALRDRTLPETLTFVTADPASGVAVTAATMVNTHMTRVYRSGDRLYADVACGTGAGSVMEVQLAIPGLGAWGAGSWTPAGGTVRTVRVQLDMPAEWTVGDPQEVYVAARRVSGTDTTTVRVLRAWQR